MNLDWVSFLLGVASLIVVEFVALLVVAVKTYKTQRANQLLDAATKATKMNSKK